MPIPIVAAGLAVAGRVAASAATRVAAGAASRAGAGAGAQSAAGTAGRMGAQAAGRQMMVNHATQNQEPRGKNFMEAAQMSQGPDVFSADLRPF